MPPGGGGDLFLRARGNPLLTAQRWPDPVNAVLNPGAALVDGVTVLLCRVEDRRGISQLTVARSADGVSNWVVDPTPLLSPSAGHPQEAWGVEDPRITRVDELDCWVIAYTAFGPQGPAVALATTRDFTSVQRLGVVRPPEDKNAALLPRRVGGDFILFHRPVSVDRRPPRGVAVPVHRSARLGRPGTGVRSPTRRVVGLRPGRHRPTPDRNPRGLAGDLPRRPGHHRRRAVPGRAAAAGPGPPHRRAQPDQRNGCSAPPNRTS